MPLFDGNPTEPLITPETQSSPILSPRKRILKIVWYIFLGFIALETLGEVTHGETSGFWLLALFGLPTLWLFKGLETRVQAIVTGVFGFIFLCSTIYSITPQGKAANVNFHTQEAHDAQVAAQKKQQEEVEDAKRQAQKDKAEAQKKALEDKEQARQDATQKVQDAANEAQQAMDEQNSYAAGIRGDSQPQKIGSACGPPAKTNPDGTISVSAKRLYYDYVTNGSAASKKYQSCPLKVTGTVLDVETTPDTEDVISWMSLVSGNTWIDDDPRTTNNAAIVCTFDAPVTQSALRRIQEANDHAESGSPKIVVTLSCTCSCDAPTATSPEIKLECRSVKVERIIR
jgi:hypothetical protein